MIVRATRRFLAVLGALIVLGVAVFLYRGMQVRGRLQDGTRVVLRKVSYGTNHTSPNARLEGLICQLPPKWCEGIGWSPSSRKDSSSTRPIFTFWLEFSTPAGATQSISYAIADENGFEASMIFDGPHGAYSPGGFSKDHAGLVRGTGYFPNRSRRFFLRLYQQVGSGERNRVAEFLVKNTRLRKNYPDWKPEDLPIEPQTNGLTFSLIKAEVGVPPPGPLVAPYDRQVGAWSEFRFRVTGQRLPSAGWIVNEVMISDAVGKPLRLSAEDNGAFNHQFTWTEGDEIACYHRWPFWPEQPAWKLRVHFERPAEGYWIEYMVRPKFL